MKEEFKSDSFQKLIQIFAREVLKDFQDHISHKFKLPSSLWIYDTNNGLNMLKPRSPFRYYPQFCEYLREIEGVSDKESHCTKYDITCMKGLIHHFNVNKSFDPFQLVNCHMNITRMVFPLSINDNVFGLLVLGKFRVDNDSSIQDIRQAINKVVSKEDYNLKKRLSHLINTLPIFNNDKINDYAIKTLELIPLLQSHYVHIQPYDPIFEGLIFIDNLDYGDSHAFLTYKAFWHNVTAFLNKIISQFNLASAIVYFSDTDNYAELHACAVAPQDHKFTKTLSLKSGQELHSLTISKKGVILPRKEEPLIWLNDFTDKIFGVKDCIVYAKYVFGGKLVFVGFGFKEDIKLTSLEKVFLKEAVLKLFRFINSALSSIELDNIMSETGHMLGRAAGEVAQGVDILKKYGHEECETDPPIIKDAKKDAKIGIESGLSKLDLIIRNHHAFSEIRNISGDPVKELKHQKVVDIIKLLRKYDYHYDNDLKTDEKYVKFDDGNVHDCKVLGREQILDLIFINLFDNAVKFSFRGTYIHIKITLEHDFYIISITNLGTGIAKDEYERVFDRYYQSRYVDRQKKRDGTGSGLAVCKRFIENYHPDGSISIVSKKAFVPTRRRWEGYNFLTTVTVSLRAYEPLKKVGE